MQKIIQLHIGETSRLFSVDEKWGINEVQAAFRAATEAAMNAGHLCTAAEIPIEILCFFGLKPYGATEIVVDNVDLQAKSLATFGVAISNCSICESCDDNVCLHYGGYVEDWRLPHDCCRSDDKRYIYYTSVEEGKECIDDFILLDEAALSDIPKLLGALAACLPNVAEMCGAEGFDVGRVNIESA